MTEWEIRSARDETLVAGLLPRLLGPGSCCVDIGANEGSFLKQFATLSPDGTHYAFEPIPSFAAALRERVPSAEVHECALSDYDGEAEFQFVPELPAWSGLQPQPYPGPATPQPITVQVRRLDDVLPGDAQIDFVKIDVEGGELGVLRGAAETLTRCQPVVLFECAAIHNTNYCTRPEQVYATLAEAGLKVFLLDGSGPLTEAEFVGVYDSSAASDYDRTAWTNFLAAPDRFPA
jgi:FkbM family methyltransferase